MNFRTSLIPQKSTGTALSYQHQGLSLGSCFAEHIGQRLEQLRYRIVRNPFGMVYNPLSLAKILRRLLANDAPRPEELFEHQGLWHHFDFHGSFSHPDATQALAQMQNSFERGRQALAQADYLLLTFGTAWLYEASSGLVNNCHKLPQQDFKRRQAQLPELLRTWQALLQEIQQQRPQMRLLLSISPVRHIRDGLAANQVSKALLRLLAEALQEKEQVEYFPAYELLLDDLRDYRFYASDLCHPNEMAVQYIWEAFEQSQLDATETPWRKKFQQLWEAEQHRPLHPQRKAHQDFLAWKDKLRQQLQKQWPQLFDKVV